MTTKKLVALEDISYRVGHSYPKEGFRLKQGQSILVADSVMAMLAVRRTGTKVRGKYKLEDK